MHDTVIETADDAGIIAFMQEFCIKRVWGFD